MIDASHLAAGLLSEPDGLAARVIHSVGLTDEQVLTALGLEQRRGRRCQMKGEGRWAGGPEALRRLRFTEQGRAAIRGAVTAALKLGHNYIGTEHLLLGILNANGDAGQVLIGLGLTAGLTEGARRGVREDPDAARRSGMTRARPREARMKALVSWEDAEGMTHRFQIAYDPDDAEARHFLEGIELHVRFRLETFDAEGDGG